jgi:2-amino-4-hydroxy-6-hydroxymethyldihydropteridine diphosphokinase
MTEVFVGCGSNIEPVRHLRWALGELERHFGVLRCSATYRSPAYGFDGPDFLNMVVGFTSAGDADAIESVLSALENACGRDVGGRTGSRTLDLDLLIFGERVDAERRLPRVDVLRYPFVLAPLAEIAPDLRHPVTGETVGAVWRRNAAAVDSLTRFDALDAA